MCWSTRTGTNPTACGSGSANWRRDLQGGAPQRTKIPVAASADTLDAVPEAACVCPCPRRVCKPTCNQRRALSQFRARHKRRHATPRGARADAQVGVLSMWWLRNCSGAQNLRLSPFSETLRGSRSKHEMSTEVISGNHGGLAPRCWCGA